VLGAELDHEHVVDLYRNDRKLADEAVFVFNLDRQIRQAKQLDRAADDRRQFARR
jgi:hypothetical protein